jgi:enolase
MRIKSVLARQIINGKGVPTLQIEVLSSRYRGASSIPIAATKSKYEFFDEYDNDVRKFHDETLHTIIDNIERILAPELIGKNCMDQEEIDKLILEVDNTLDRSSLGVNTLTAVSQAVAKLGAKESELPLFKYVRVLYDFTGHPVQKLNSIYKMPIPVLTIYQSAGHNKKRKLPAQEILVSPKSGFSYSRDLIDLFQSIHQINLEGGNETLEEVLKQAHFKLLDLNVKLSLGLDMSASKYKRAEDGNYVVPYLNSDKVNFIGNSDKLAEVYSKWVQEYGLYFLEDLFDEDDFSAWKKLKDGLLSTNDKIQIVADDLTATNIERLDKVGALDCANNVVIKPSQIGTVSESIHFAQRARKYNENVTVSYRFGETEDTFIADLAVGLNADFVRTGYYLGTEYNCKLNRLLRIEESVG